MPMPRLPEIHHKNADMKTAFQLKKNKAVKAPKWKAIMKDEVIQLT